MVSVRCGVCGIEFDTQRPMQAKFCGDRCRKRAQRGHAVDAAALPASREVTLSVRVSAPVADALERRPASLGESVSDMLLQFVECTAWAPVLQVVDPRSDAAVGLLLSMPGQVLGDE